MDADDDRQLLARYVDSGDQQAFAALARRHAALVYSAARRRVRDAALAHDVTQVVFLVLARRARTIRAGTVLSAWLLKATRYTASNMTKSEHRRRQRERRAALQKPESSQAPPTVESDGWEQVAPLLDDALHSLGESGRSAVVLRWFEGRSYRDVGERLGVSEDAAKQKVFRALGRMRKYLLRRGVAVPAASLTTLIAANATHAAPLATVQAAAAAGVPGALAAAAGSQATAQAVATLMGWTKAKVLAGVAAAMLVASGAGVAVHAVLAENRGTLTVDRRIVQPVSPPPAAAIAPPRGVVFAPDGKPLKDAFVVISTPSDPTFAGKAGLTPARTDADGRFSLPPVTEPYLLIAWRDDAGFAEVTGEQLADGGAVRLSPWARVEGTVKAAGEPVAGATVVLTHWPGGGTSLQAASWIVEVRADAAGRYVCDRVPPGEGWVGRQIPAGDGGPPLTLQQTYLTAEPAQRLDLPIGGAAGARTVVGKLRDDTGRAGRPARWRVSLVKPIEPPVEGGQHAGQARYRGVMFSTGLPVSPDGSFATADVPPGPYRLIVQEVVPTNGRSPSNVTIRDVEVSADGGDRPAPLNLGTIPVRSAPADDTSRAATPMDAREGRVP